MTSQTRSALLLALATFALALSVRLLGVDLREPWLDEVYTQFAVSRDWYGLASDRISRGHSPLYFALMKLLGIPGESVVAMRTASSVLDAAGAAILAGAVARFVTWRAALFFGILYSFSPIAIHWAQEARPYGLLIFFLGIGVTGAMGLMASRSTIGGAEPPEPHLSRKLFGFGFSFASLTITAGIFSFLAVAALPFSLPKYRADKAFMTRWKRALKAPAIVSVLAYFALSGPHIARNVDGYWAEKYNPLGIGGLSRLWSTMVVDGGLPPGLVSIGLSPTLAMPMLWLASLLLLGFLLLGLRQTREAPALLAPAGLMVFYTLLLICVSIWTSVLVGRYFLPAWICLLALAGAGMATASQRTIGWAAILPLLVFAFFTGLGQAQLSTPPRERPLAAVADIIARTPPETTRILYERLDDVRNELIMELFPLNYPRPELERPALSSVTRERFDDALAEEMDLFVYMTSGQLDAFLGDALPEPACIHAFDGGWRLAYWGKAPEVCAPG